MFAEDLVDLLAEKNLVSPDLAKGLRSRLIATPKSIPAETFADRLVEQGVLTSSLARALLRQIQPTQNPPTETAPTTPSSLSPSFPPPPSPQKQTPSPSPFSLPAPVEQPYVMPAQARPQIPDQSKSPTSRSRIVDNTRLASGKLRTKKQKNQWDTKLILLGSAALLALCLSALFLGSSLLRRNADSMLSKANQEYEKASYSQAILGYDEYLKAFPNHSGASTAKIRAALSKIRLMVDSKSDWLKTYETTVQEIEGIENESSFFDESKAELSVLLPKIASGLAGQAKEKESLFHAERAEQTLEMIERLLPRSLRPVDQIAEINSQIREVRRIVFCDNALKQTTDEIGSLTRRENFNLQNLSRCYEQIDFLLKNYPELSANDRLVDVLVQISESESRATVFDSEATKQVDRLVRSEDIFPKKTIPNANILATLFDQSVQETISLSNGFPSSILYTENKIYGLRTSDGMPVWSRNFENKNSSPFAPSGSPKIVPVFQSKSNPKASFLYIDHQNHHLVRIDAETGAFLHAYNVGKPFFLSNVQQGESRDFVALTTRTGRLCVLSVLADSMEEKRVLQLPQSVDSAPAISAQGKFVCQLAERNTLYVISVDEPENIRSVYVGQKISTNRISPAFIGTYLLVVQQSGIKNCELLVCDPDRSGKDIVRQNLPIRGLVDTDLAVSPPFLALISDEGETLLFQTAEDTSPLRLLASGSAGNDLLKSGVMRYLSLFGRNVWLADLQLMKFDFQPTQSRLLPGQTLRRNILTHCPPFSLESSLFHSFYDSLSQSYGMEAVSTKKNSINWETELGCSVAMTPVLNEEGDKKTLNVYSSGGKVWSVEIPERINEQKTDADELKLRKPDRQMPKGVFGKNSLNNVLFLEGGYQVWMPDLSASPAGTENRTLLFYDPKASENNRFRSIFLPGPIADEPVLMNASLLIPMRDGRIILIDPKTGKPVSETFTPLRSDMATPKWFSPLVLQNNTQFLIADNCLDENGLASLQKIELVSENDKQKFVQKESVSLDHPAVSKLLQFDRDRIAFIDQKNIFRVLNLKELDKGSEKRESSKPDFEISEQISAKCVWGPILCGQTILFACENQKMYAMQTDGTMIFKEMSIPVGKAFETENGIVLNSSDGLLWKINPQTLETLSSTRTGIQTRTGPIVSSDRVFLVDLNGVIYETKIGRNADAEGKDKP